MAHISALTHQYPEASFDLERLIANLLDLNVYLLVEVLPQLEELLLFGHTGKCAWILRVLFSYVEVSSEYVLLFGAVVFSSATTTESQSELAEFVKRHHVAIV